MSDKSQDRTDMQSLASAVRNDPNLWSRVIAHQDRRRMGDETEHGVEYLGDLYTFVRSKKPDFPQRDVPELVRIIVAMTYRD